jgi:zinc transport system substrate-binding protein
VRALLAVVVVAFAAGCTGGTSGAKPTVVASFYPLAWAAQQVSSGGVEIENLTPPGVEPHDLELTPRDVEAVRGADRVLYLGHGFQPALEDAVRGNTNALDLLEGQRLRTGSEDAGKSGHDGDVAVDPHVWLDPMRFAAIATEIAGALGDRKAAEPLRAKLEALDAEFRSGLAHCQRRELVTSHAAFGYLADAYGLEQVALTGLSPEAEPSPRTLERLVAEVEKTGATTVFFETLVSPRLAETVAREAGVGTAELDPLEGLTDDEVAAGADYLSVMRQNLASLREALGCR